MKRCQVGISLSINRAQHLGVKSHLGLNMEAMPLRFRLRKPFTEPKLRSNDYYIDLTETDQVAGEVVFDLSQEDDPISEYVEILPKSLDKDVNPVPAALQPQSKGEDISCSICNRYFTPKQYLIHSKMFHPANRPIKESSDSSANSPNCEEHLTFQSPQFSKDSSEEYSDISSSLAVFCEICGWSTLNSADLGKHTNEAHLDFRFVCFICGTTYQFLDELLQHLRKYPEDQVSAAESIFLKKRKSGAFNRYPYYCKLCGKGFHLIKLLKDHQFLEENVSKKADTDISVSGFKIINEIVITPAQQVQEVTAKMIPVNEVAPFSSWSSEGPLMTEKTKKRHAAEANPLPSSKSTIETHTYKERNSCSLLYEKTSLQQITNGNSTVEPTQRAPAPKIKNQEDSQQKTSAVSSSAFPSKINKKAIEKPVSKHISSSCIQKADNLDDSQRKFSVTSSAAAETAFLNEKSALKGLSVTCNQKTENQSDQLQWTDAVESTFLNPPNTAATLKTFVENPVLKNSFSNCNQGTKAQDQATASSEAETAFWNPRATTKKTANSTAFIQKPLLMDILPNDDHEAPIQSDMQRQTTEIAKGQKVGFESPSFLKKPTAQHVFSIPFERTKDEGTSKISNSLSLITQEGHSDAKTSTDFFPIPEVGTNPLSLPNHPPEGSNTQYTYDDALVDFLKVEEQLQTKNVIDTNSRLLYTSSPPSLLKLEVSQHICDVCGVNCRHFIELTLHKFRCHAEKHFSCLLCPTGWETVSALCRHQETSHDSAQYLQVEMARGGKNGSSSSTDDLAALSSPSLPKKGKLTHYHKELSGRANIANLLRAKICKFCDEIFNFNFELKAHLSKRCKEFAHYRQKTRVTLREKGICKYCNLKMKTSCSLRVHQLIYCQGIRAGSILSGKQIKFVRSVRRFDNVVKNGDALLSNTLLDESELVRVSKYIGKDEDDVQGFIDNENVAVLDQKEGQEPQNVTEDTTILDISVQVDVKEVCPPDGNSELESNGAASAAEEQESHQLDVKMKIIEDVNYTGQINVLQNDLTKIYPSNPEVVNNENIHSAEKLEGLSSSLVDLIENNQMETCSSSMRLEQDVLTTVDSVLRKQVSEAKYDGKVGKTENPSFTLLQDSDVSSSDNNGEHAPEVNTFNNDQDVNSAKDYKVHCDIEQETVRRAEEIDDSVSNLPKDDICSILDTNGEDAQVNTFANDQNLNSAEDQEYVIKTQAVENIQEDDLSKNTQSTLKGSIDCVVDEELEEGEIIDTDDCEDIQKNTEKSLQSNRLVMEKLSTLKQKISLKPIGAVKPTLIELQPNVLEELTCDIAMDAPVSENINNNADSRKKRLRIEAPQSRAPTWINNYNRTFTNNTFDFRKPLPKKIVDLREKLNSKVKSCSDNTEPVVEPDNVTKPPCCLETEDGAPVIQLESETSVLIEPEIEIPVINLKPSPVSTAPALIHSPPRPAIFCEECGGKMCTDKEIENPRCHHRLTIFRCGSCKGLFQNLNFLIAHQQERHDPTEFALNEIKRKAFRKYFCFLCGQDFNFINNLVSHQVAEHKYQPGAVVRAGNPTLKGSYVCVFCNEMIFPDLPSLIQHVNESKRHKENAILFKNLEGNYVPVEKFQYIHVCYVCNLGFATFKKLQLHVLMSVGHYLESNQQHQIDNNQCFKVTPSLMTPMDVGTSSHRRSDGYNRCYGQCRCFMCDEFFDNDDLLKQHVCKGPF